MQDEGDALGGGHGLQDDEEGHGHRLVRDQLVGGPVGHAVGFLVLASIQVAVGIAHIPSVHLPLGVLMFGLSVLALPRR